MNRATKERLHRISAFVMALALIMTTIVPYSYLSGIFAITAKAETVKYVLNADEIGSQYVTGSTINETVPCGTSDYFTLGKSLKVDTSKKTVTVEEGNLEITNRIKTGAQNPSKDKGISFTVSSGMEATIEVSTITSTTGTDTKIALYDSDNKVVTDTLYDVTASKTPETKKWTNIPAGSYYISVGSGADASANFYYVAVTEEPTVSYNVSCSIAVGDTDVSTYDLSGTYKSSPLTANAGELAEALEDNESLIVTPATGDTLASGLNGIYTATVNANDRLIVVKIGDVTVANISYSVAGEVKSATATWSYADGTVYDSTGSEVAVGTTVSGSGTLKNTAGDVITVSGSFQKRIETKGDYWIVTGAEIKVPVVSGATKATIKFDAYTALTNANITVGNVTKSTITSGTSNWAENVIECELSGEVDYITLKFVNENYFKTFTVTSEKEEDNESNETTSYVLSASIAIGDDTTYSLSGNYLDTALEKNAGKIATALENGKSLTVTAQEGDTAAALGIYTATVNATDKIIVVKAGETTVANISYVVAARLPADGTLTTWNFKENILGLDTSVTVPSEGVTSSDGILTIYGNGMTWNNGHGAWAKNGGDKITIDVAAGKTTVTLAVCKYTSPNTAVATLTNNNSTISLYNETDAKENSFIFVSKEPATLEITLGNGGYIHYITAKTEEIKPTVKVSGTVGDTNADGQKLLFKSGTATAATATITNGAYSVDLEAGSYTVEFENSTLYEVTSDNTITVAENSEAITKDITYTAWSSDKKFTITVGDTEFTVTPGANKSADFTAEKVSGSGEVEVVTSSTAIFWTNLNGGGSGTLSDDEISTSENVKYSFSGNTITVNYTDTASNPISYTIIVKDNSATGEPQKDGTLINYDFLGGKVISSLHDENHALRKGATLQTVDKLVTFTGNSKIKFNNTTHGIAINPTDTISVKVAGDATITLVTCASSSTTGMFTVTGLAANATITPTEAVACTADGTYTVFKYTGDETTLVFTYSATGTEKTTGYLHGMTVTNAAPVTAENTQTAMPKVYSYGSAASLEVTAVGQRLNLTQTGGSLGTTNDAVDKSVSYFGFDATSDVTKLTADVTINAGGTSSSSGVFFGAFDGTNIATIGIRGLTGLRGIYSKSASERAGAGGVDKGITSGQTVTFTVVKTDDGLVITATPKGGDTQTLTVPYNKDSYQLLSANGKNQEVSYGFILSNVTATIQNMKYYNASGVCVYDQNDCYAAYGTTPVVSQVSAKAASTRQYITVDWTASKAATGDGMYLLQVSTDSGKTWTSVATDLTETTYKYNISEAGTYLFRVCGKLGINGAADVDNFVTSDALEVIAALDSPVVNISSTVSKVDLSWEAVNKAVRYEVYRYSYDDTAEKAEIIAEVRDTSYEDTAVTAEMPYYYYVVAYSDDNYSNPSETVWAVPSAGHTGTYVYEDDAAGITVTKKSYDTVYNGKITLEGVVEKAGTVALLVNGKTVDTQTVSIRGTFAFDDVEIVEGRNDVNIEVTDTDGNVTRQTFNFVYLTNYDKVVDAAFTGTDGEEVNGIPTYKTVQAAVDSVASSNSQRVVILVKAGDYEEHLTVSTPNITLIGEDSTKTRIFYDTKDYVGGDMKLRCAVFIDSSATGFSAENLTFENTYEYLGDGTISNESCDALRNDANNTSYVNVRILGYQDTLNANGGTQYYYKCYIAGNVDFIYGNEPRALFNDCQLVFRYNSNKNSGYVCAPRTSADAAYGLTFYNCQVLSEDGCSGSKYYLARPWGADAYITWINCYMGKIIKANAANPYSDMSGNAATAARFFEYGSYGAGYAINTYRRQISKTMADKMITTSYLTWDPYTAVSNIGNAYKGAVTTDTTDKFIETKYVTDSYATTDGDDTGLSKYSIEGYAQAAKVTGGGTLYETSKNYYAVGTAEEFLTALMNIKKSGMASVIELTGDIALGSKEIENFDSYSSIIKAHTYQALTHPTLIETGVSMLKLDSMSNLTIYSKNGAKITHACTDITNSSNIIIRNITFDELWEWDDYTEGGYDRNDWDYMTIEKGSHDIWIDHCTFYKAYDGVIDIKTPTVSSNITISWCSFQPASEGQKSYTDRDSDTFFNAMMSAMEAAYEAGSDKYTYYNHLRDEGMTADEIRGYAYGQKKTHLLGQSDTDSSATNITATFANNWYNNSMDRMPRLRFGTAHVYNCIMDAQNLREIKLGITAHVGAELAKKIVSNGTSSNMGAHVLLENCYISGITNALISGNGDSQPGYINAVNSVYYIDGEAAELEVINNNDSKTVEPLVQNAAEFIEALPYSGYNLYSADSLYEVVQPYTGAGVLDLTTLQWEKTVYNDQHTHTWDDGVVTKEATCGAEGTFVYTCTGCGAQKTIIIPATDKHNYSEEWTIDRDATTEEAGQKSHHCTVCGDKTDITEIPKLETPSDNSGDNNTDDNTGETPSNPSDNTGDNSGDNNTDDTTGETPSNPSDNTDNTTGNTPSETPTQPEVEISDSEAGVAEIIVSKVTEDVPQAGFTESKSELLNKLLTAEEKVEVKAGANVKVSMKVETVKADDKPVESVAIKTAVEALTEQNTIGIYLDITLEKNVGNGVPVQVKETVGGKLSISVEVPAEMINTDSTKTRKYSVARYHDGVVDILDCNFADGKITFESDKFSVYAIIYSDSDITTSDKNDNNTQAATEASNEATTAAQQTGETPTGDSLSLAYVLGLFVLLMMSAVTLAVLLRKKES